MNITIDKKLNILLKETREKQGISIENASATTKIRKSILIEIEKGNYQAIPSEIHLKNFILSYGKFLGIPQEKIIALYRRDLNQKNNNTITQNNKVRNLLQKSQLSQILKSIKKYLFTIKTLVILLTICIIAIISYFFYKTWLASNTPPSLIIINPQNNQVIKQKIFSIEGISSSPDVKIYVDGIEAVYLNSEGKFKVDAKFNNPGLKRFNIIAINPLQKKSEYVLDLIYEPEDDYQTITKEKFIKITNISKESKKIIINTTKTEEIFLNPNQYYQFKLTGLTEKEIKIMNPEKAKLLITYLKSNNNQKQEYEITEFDKTIILIKIIENENIFVIENND